VIDQTGLQYTVHIFGCTNSTIRIIGKINAVSMGKLFFSFRRM
jgi:adenylyl cyclase-associated protein